MLFVEWWASAEIHDLASSKALAPGRQCHQASKGCHLLLRRLQVGAGDPCGVFLHLVGGLDQHLNHAIAGTGGDRRVYCLLNTHRFGGVRHHKVGGFRLQKLLKAGWRRVEAQW